MIARISRNFKSVVLAICSVQYAVEHCEVFHGFIFLIDRFSCFVRGCFFFVLKIKFKIRIIRRHHVDNKFEVTCYIAVLNVIRSYIVKRPAHTRTPCVLLLLSTVDIINNIVRY